MKLTIMKLTITRLSIWILAAFAANTAFAERTLLTPGKSWTICEHRIANVVVKTKAKVEVCNDTIIENKPATMVKFFYLGRPEEPIYYPCWEDNGRIYSCDFGLWMDFNLKPGDELSAYDNENNFKVLSENTLEVNGRNFRELTIGNLSGVPIDSWVEGVGCKNGIGTYFGHETVISPYRLDSYRIIDCSENGKVIFTENDFSVKQRPTADSLPLFELGRWWTLDVTLPDSSTVGARAEIVGVETVGDKDYATVKLEIIGSEPSTFRVYDYNHRIFVEDNIDYPIMDLGIVAGSKFGRFYRFNADRTTLELTDEEFGCHGSMPTGPDSFCCLQNLIARSDSDDKVTWAEGIGASKSMWITENGPQTILGYRMKECGQGSEVIFTSRDFYFTPSSLTEVKSPYCADGAVYDLQGRRVANPGRGLYIVNGRKTLLR